MFDKLAYGMDSVSLIRLIVTLEEKYNIEFQENDMYIEKMNTINKLIGLLKIY